MRTLPALIICIFFITSAFSQNLAHITIDNRGSSDVIAFSVDNNVFVNLTKDGNLIDWGVQDNTPGPKTFPPKLAKYMGREEYYSQTENKAYAGKIKYIGSTLVTYYTSDDNEMLKGKVKTVGSRYFDYYIAYDDAAFKGNIKTAGPVTFTYYASFEDDDFKGKIKSVGSTMLTYYGSVDDKAFKGKIKSIDRNLFTYYSSYERKEYSGMSKSGIQWRFQGVCNFLLRIIELQQHCITIRAFSVISVLGITYS